MPSAVIIGIDGLGAWYMKRSAHFGELCPTLRGLFSTSNEEVRYASMSARTIYPPVSAAGWAAVLCGQTPDQTGITENRWPLGVVGADGVVDEKAGRFVPRSVDAPEGEVVPPPSLLSQVPLQGGSRKHLSVVSWGWIAKLSAHIPDRCDTIDANKNDALATDEFCARWVPDSRGLLPAVAFLHLDEVDGAGHKHSWGSEEYQASWTEADSRVARVLEHIRSVQTEPTLVVVCSDHGGSGTGHGDNDVRHMEVPLIVTIVGAPRQQHTPTGIAAATASVLDIAPTITEFLGLPQVPSHRGRALNVI